MATKYEEKMTTEYEENIRRIKSDAERQIAENEAGFKLQLENFRKQIDKETQLLNETRIKLEQDDHTLKWCKFWFLVIGFVAIYHIIPDHS